MELLTFFPTMKKHADSIETASLAANVYIGTAATSVTSTALSAGVITDQTVVP